MKKYVFLLFLMVMFYLPNVNAMEIFVQKPDASTLTIEVESSDTTEVVKEKIFQLDNSFYPEFQILTFGGTLLEDGRTLADYGIVRDNPDKTIILSLKKFNVLFDANGGKFNDVDSYFVSWDDTSYDNLVEPSREGYYFSGYYTEKEGGTKLELILAESGIDQDMTFYAHWEKAIDNPETSSDRGNTALLVILLIESAFIVSTLFSKKCKRYC